MGNWCEWISDLYKVKLFSYYRPAAANGKWKAALVIVYLSQVTTTINILVCKLFISWSVSICLFHVAMSQVRRASDTCRCISSDQMGESERQRSHRCLYTVLCSHADPEPGEESGRGGHQLLQHLQLFCHWYVRTLSTASVAASPWNITRKAYKETVRKIRTVCLILDVLTRFCSCQCSEFNEVLEVSTSGVFLDWKCSRWSPSEQK